MLSQGIARNPVKRLAPEATWSPSIKKSSPGSLNQGIVIKEEVDPDENIGMTAAEMNMLLWQQSQQQAAAMAVAAAAAGLTPSSHLAGIFHAPFVNKLAYCGLPHMKCLK